MKLIWHPAAAQDIEEIWEYSFQNWGMAQAETYVQTISDTALALASGDLGGTEMPNLGAGLRRQIIGSHVLWFRIGDGFLTSGRVLHQSRDVGRLVG